MVFLYIAAGSTHTAEGCMEWTKPEFTVVAVTMEVTAYAATK
ncbi:MAG: pyrroloquinoline quinone precursor peptide PqqA [Acidobacteria bacterium]|nr:pyrroloquinoline quinone precursor peptide PqqA [Acidobacteriota bacterium]